MQIQRQSISIEQDHLSSDNIQDFAFASPLSPDEIRTVLANHYQRDVWGISGNSALLEFYPIDAHVTGFTLYKPVPSIRPYVVLRGEIVYTQNSTFIRGQAQLYLGSLYTVVRIALAFVVIVLFTSAVYDVNLPGVLVTLIAGSLLVFVNSTIHRQVSYSIDAMQALLQKNR